MSESRASVAARVAEARKLAGLTQQQLADKSNVSVGLLRSVEQKRVSATPGFLGAVSKALNVSVTELTGQPYPPAPGPDTQVHTAISILRAELAAYDMDNTRVTETRPMQEMAASVVKVRRSRRAASFHRLGESLPPLLGELRAAVHRSRGSERIEALTLMCELYYSCHSLAHKLGYIDLAALAVDRMAWAASEADHGLWVAAAQFQRAAGLTAGGDWAAALAYLERCRAKIEPRLGIGRRDDLIAWGGLHLQSGLAASRSGKRDLADAHLAEARATALRLGDDRDPILSFGPTNVGIWSVALAVEAMDGTEALNRARSLVIPTDAPKERAGHHYIDLSRAHLLHGDRRRSFAALQMAKDIAPSQTRYNPMVHETVRALARAEARTVDTVHGFAVWCGIAERL
ncbi:helix-turn-helix domain-containing protein [Nocardia cyriacigeorgica]|jgi:transcriptional regulator with XRE-family HTH domain|uniref:helix-turn-helix domain-containing protein n=1 Tax=Nocardia cyriacigeorgica TaxID=135487 RepID=UPI000CEA38FC|nr:helix-turn-helix transcriptional regulator [Nocardia cyriacigeorgica]AVH21321.1 transcriptional regulator [Nocardia cyriacigeorgica]MBF6324489.1 helix-turn-helix transcriptional regulator [Nocardia cyriacigeorgica]PPJ06805.1 transcriptional regulator [Nocardia cyriacigeorgica]